MKTCYLAGPMRHRERFNFDRFEEATRILEGLGLEVISPHRMDLDIGFDPKRDLESQKFSLTDAVRRDVEAIIQVDGVVMLEGWEFSVGATAERAVANWLGKPVYDIREFERATC